MELMDLMFEMAALLGLISLSRLIFGAVNFVWVMFLRKPKDLVKCYGTWALVTGATDGIGRAMAFQLASKGLSLILLARNPSKLESTSQELAEKFGNKVAVKCIVADFDKLKKDEIVKAVQEGIQGLDVGILINNAGVIYDFPKFIHEADPQMVESLLNVNIGGLTWTTMAVLRSMLKRKRGAIVNVGSGTAHVMPGCALLAAYCASKAYIEYFSKSVTLEFKAHGIDIQCQIPLLVETKTIGAIKAGWLSPSPETWSKASIRWIGYEAVCIPYWVHYMETIVFRTMPILIPNGYTLRGRLLLRKQRMEEKHAMELDVRDKKDP
uniref:Uncharacterized protein n=1 Tax=Kalanchoe fedtschenkoi TaxID=63787 RepID=A0A7N0TE67_KALFE